MCAYLYDGLARNKLVEDGLSWWLGWWHKGGNQPLQNLTRPFHRSEFCASPTCVAGSCSPVVWSLCDRTSMVVGRRPFPSSSILGRALLLMSSSPAHTLATTKAPRFPRDSNALTALRAWATADNNDGPSQIVDVRVAATQLPPVHVHDCLPELTTQNLANLPLTKRAFLCT